MTKVIFRKFNDGINEDVIALFPELAGNISFDTCLSYMHVGQHGSASVNIFGWTVPASPEEYKPLYDELVSLGYDNLEIRQRFTRKDLEARKEQVKS